MKEKTITKNSFHPGVYLKELLDDYKISAYKLSKDTFMPATRISEIIKGRRRVSPDTAMRLGKYFGNTPEQWLNLQGSYDMFLCEPENLEKIIPFAANASLGNKFNKKKKAKS